MRSIVRSISAKVSGVAISARELPVLNTITPAIKYPTADTAAAVKA